MDTGMTRAPWFAGLWRKGAGTPDDPDNGRLIWRILGIYPSRWTCSREWFARDLWPTWRSWFFTFLNEITRYRYETCQRCGRQVARGIDTYWLADDAFWVEIVGHGGGCLCPRCFTQAARRRGVAVYWKPILWNRKTAPGRGRAVSYGSALQSEAVTAGGGSDPRAATSQEPS